MGDIVVTGVADQYAIGRMSADGKTQELLGLQQSREKALQLARVLAGTQYRVFLYWSAGTNDYLPVHVAKQSK